MFGTLKRNQGNMLRFSNSFVLGGGGEGCFFGWGRGRKQTFPVGSLNLGPYFFDYPTFFVVFMFLDFLFGDYKPTCKMGCGQRAGWGLEELSMKPLVDII